MYSRVANAPVGYTRFRLTYSWAWLEAPFWTLHDKVAIAWSYDWASVPGTSSWKYIAEGVEDVYEFTGTDVTSPSVTSKAYVFDILSSYYGDPIASHSGWLTTTVQCPTGSGGGQIAVLGRYFHQNMSLDGSISASGEPSLSINPSYAYDWSEGEADLYEFTW